MLPPVSYLRWSRPAPGYVLPIINNYKSLREKDVTDVTANPETLALTAFDPVTSPKF